MHQEKRLACEVVDVQQQLRRVHKVADGIRYVAARIGVEQVPDLCSASDLTNKKSRESLMSHRMKTRPSASHVTPANPQ